MMIVGQLIVVETELMQDRREQIGNTNRIFGRPIANLVRRGLTHFPVGQAVRIRLNPEDLTLISGVERSDHTSIPIAPSREIRWLPDPRIERGGCIVEGVDQVIDGRLDRTLERMYRRLIGE